MKNVSKNVLSDQDKINNFALYLYHFKGIRSSVKIQKIMFFVRVYEKTKKVSNSPIFSENRNHFKAWIYGPVNPISYHYIYSIINKEEEISDDALSSIKPEDYKAYDKIVDHLKQYDPDELIEYSHTNLSYKNAREGLYDNEPGKKYLEENSDSFMKFEDGNDIFADIDED